MVQASVGFHCTECARSGRQQVRTGRQLFGTGAGAAFRPLVTQVLIGINAAVFLLDVALGGSLFRGNGELTADGALLGAPTNVFGQLLLGPGGDPVIGVASGEWWRLITGGFLHGGLVHLGMNMLVLYLIGPLLERELGKLNFALLYFTALVAGSLGVMLIDPFAVTVGASGAIYGLLGGAVALQLSRGVNPWSSGIGGLILINVLITFTVPGISIGGHLGGLVGGFVAGWVLVKLDERAPGPVAPAVCAVLMVALFAASVWAAEYSVTNLSPVINV
jgi:membrane associated rhomboid family serine protease